MKPRQPSTKKGDAEPRAFSSKTVEEALECQRRQAKFMSGMVHRIRQTLDLEVMLATTVQEVREFLQADRVVILRKSSSRCFMTIAEAVEDAYPPLLHTRFYDDVLNRDPSTGSLTTESQLATSALPASHIDLMQEFEVQAYVLAPILYDNKTWGMLMAHQCAAPRQWQPSELEVLAEMTEQVAIAIQQAELYQQVQRLNADLETQVQERTAQLQEVLDFESLLKRITDRVRDSLDEAQILQSAIQELALGLEVGACTTAAYNLAEQQVVPKYQFMNFFSSVRQRERPLEPELFTQLLEGQCLQFCEYHPIWGRTSILLCPVQDDQGIFGELRLVTYCNRVFDDLEIRVVEQVANHCAIAIRQARLYQAAQAQVQELERLNQLKDDFLSTVSHELRTPMANIKMALQMLELFASKTELPAPFLEQFQRYSAIMTDESHREISLINDLLDLSRLDARAEPIVPTNIDLVPWLEHVTRPFVERAQAQHQALTLHFDETLGAVSVDLTHLELILAELLNNACKYTPPNEEVTVVAHATSRALHLTVINSGIEIQASEFEHIFEKFYRIPNGDPWKHGGTGLGLALVKKRVEYLGGKIEVKAAYGRTIFTVHLPFAYVACGG